MITLLLRWKQIVRKFCLVYFFTCLSESGGTLMVRWFHNHAEATGQCSVLRALPNTKELIIMNQKSKNLVFSSCPIPQYDLEQIISLFWTSVFSSVKQWVQLGGSSRDFRFWNVMTMIWMMVKMKLVNPKCIQIHQMRDWEAANYLLWNVCKQAASAYFYI